MKRLLAGLAAGLALLAPAMAVQAQESRMARGGGMRGGPGGIGQRGYANPSAAIAAEIAFARLVRDKGRWAAFRATAAPDAVMFVPAMVLAQQWLKGRTDPAAPLAWQPHRVWSSCDGTLMVTTGAWQDSGGQGTGGQDTEDRQGRFTTIWQRQSDGGYKWVFIHRDVAKGPLPEPEMIPARVADCPDRRPGERPAGLPGRSGSPKKPGAPGLKELLAAFDPAARQGRSQDGTLVWQVTADAAGMRDFSAKLMTGGQMQEIGKEPVAAGS
ncbi:MAG: hypothetical protein LBV50_09635 [Novosphingobium sp.]|nr:hypothetical protein [Novosphingobium sp.]